MDGPGKPGRPRKGQAQVNINERRAENLRLRARGHRFDEIAQRLGYSSAVTASNDYNRAIEASRKLRNAAAADHVELENVKLDTLEVVTWALIEAKYFVVNQGNLVYIGLDEQELMDAKESDFLDKPAALASFVQRLSADAGTRVPLKDLGPVVKAVETMIKLMERRAKLNGLDAPVKKFVEVSGVGGVDDDIRRVMDDLARRQEGGPASGTATGEGQA